MMTPLIPDDDRAETAVWQAMVLFSSLSTATEVWQVARERRAGRDPSGQEDAAVVRLYLHIAAGELQAALMQLQSSRLHADRATESALATLVRRYNDLMTLRRIERLLHVIHQRLLSLYPAISETLVEDARLLHNQSSSLLASAAFLDELDSFCHEGLMFTGDLMRMGA